MTPSAPPTRSAATPPRSTEPRITTSVALLAGAVELRIEHRGEVYRLRRTAQDKLILTK
jgi:hemin uptake protein HemP